MQITYLGQQGWMLSSNGTTVLVDPVLTEYFGTSQHIKFSIYPPRNILIEKLGKIDAACITNEHLDHFHVPSLRMIERSVPILVGVMMPDCVKQTILDMGFQLIECEHLAWTGIKNLKIQFTIGSANVPFWEKRVYHCYITNHDGKGALIQSDTLLSESLTSRIQQGIDPRPYIFIATNNSQPLPSGLFGAFSNMLPLEHSKSQAFEGIRIFTEVLCEVPQALGEVPYMLLSGGGYIMEGPNYIPFPFTNKGLMQNVLDTLALETKAYYLYPGEELSFTDQVTLTQHPAINLDIEKLNFIQERNIAEDPRKSNKITKPIFYKSSEVTFNEINLALVKQEMADMSACLLFSSLGEKLLHTNKYINGPLGSERFLIQLKYGRNKAVNFVFDLASGRFKFKEDNIKQPMVDYPFGIMLFFNDFVALIRGHIQIWELATANSRQWYFSNDKLSSPVAFLYEYFSEQLRPDLAQKVYAKLKAT